MLYITLQETLQSKNYFKWQKYKTVWIELRIYNSNRLFCKVLNILCFNKRKKAFINQSVKVTQTTDLIQFWFDLIAFLPWDTTINVLIPNEKKDPYSNPRLTSKIKTFAKIVRQYVFPLSSLFSTFYLLSSHYYMF